MIEFCPKKRFPSRKDAKKQMKRQNSYQFRTYTVGDVYKCTICGYWHLTSIDKINSRELSRKNNAY